ncbi:MAG: hemin uptake protein HemP [Betaproteobacteria bacterium]
MDNQLSLQPLPAMASNVEPARDPRTFWRSERVRRVASDALFEDCGEVQIEHRGSVYRLKQTSLGKLILTK